MPQDVFRGMRHRLFMKKISLLKTALLFVELDFLTFAFFVSFYVAIRSSIFWGLGFLMVILFLKELLIPEYLEL